MILEHLGPYYGIASTDFLLILSLLLRQFMLLLAVVDEELVRHASLIVLRHSMCFVQHRHLHLASSGCFDGRVVA